MTNKIINPTGSYFLNRKTKTIKGEIYGYFGDISVKLLTKNQIAIRLFVCRGAPGYNSGTLADTLSFNNGIATYRTSEYNGSCKIIFSFKKGGINVEEITDDTSACGFGYGVCSNGFYKRKSGKTPANKDLNY